MTTWPKINFLNLAHVWPPNFKVNVRSRMSEYDKKRRKRTHKQRKKKVREILPIAWPWGQKSKVYSSPFFPSFLFWDPRNRCKNWDRSTSEIPAYFYTAGTKKVKSKCSQQKRTFWALNAIGKDTVHLELSQIAERRILRTSRPSEMSRANACYF